VVRVCEARNKAYASSDIVTVLGRKIFMAISAIEILI